MSTSTLLKPKKRNILNPLNAWRIFSQKGLNTGISSSPQHEGLSILGSESTDPEQLQKDFGCCCEKIECIQAPIVCPVAATIWPGLEIKEEGDIRCFGSYDGVINGFWQGHSAAGTSPSAVTLTFTGKKPAKIIVLCTAMNSGETQSFQVQGSAGEANIDLVRPDGVYTSGPIGPNSGTIRRIDPGGSGDSRFRLTVTESTQGSITGFVWSHATTSNMNGMVNAIYLCSSKSDESTTFVDQ